MINYIIVYSCIFVLRGQVIGSVSTKQKQAVPLFELIDSEDINNLIHMCKLIDQCSSDSEPNLRKKLQHHVEQVWVHFRTRHSPSLPPNRRQLVNAFLFSLSGEIDLICINAVDQSAPIHIVSDLLDLLEDLDRIEDRATFVARVGEQVQKLTNSIANLRCKGSEELKFVFLDNATRTSTLIKVSTKEKTKIIDKYFLEPLVETSCGNSEINEGNSYSTWKNFVKFVITICIKSSPYMEFNCIFAFYSF